MADARSSEHSAHEGDLRGAANAAPDPATPLTLVEASIAGLEALVAEAHRLADDISEAELSAGPDAGNGHRSAAAASLLSELRDTELVIDAAEEDTYRLLVSVLIHNPLELRALREHTIGPLETSTLGTRRSSWPRSNGSSPTTARPRTRPTSCSCTVTPWAIA